MFCLPSGSVLNGGAGLFPRLRIRDTLVRLRKLATVANYIGLPTPSPEQELVIKALKQGRNARVNAVAGSGKTTTILQVAQALPSRKILGIPTFE
jgi:superfamily II DNA or RNA helicase